MAKICQNGQIRKYLLILMKFCQICLFFFFFLWHSFLDISRFSCTHSLYLYTCESNSSSFVSELSSDVHENSSVKKKCTRISLHVVTALSCWKTFDKFCNLNEEEIIINKNSRHNNPKGTMEWLGCHFTLYLVPVFWWRKIPSFYSVYLKVVHMFMCIQDHQEFMENNSS